jgi:DNA-binding NarL/FixJ family response regulator
VIVTGPDAETGERAQRLRPLRVRLDIADRALRADIADACEDAGIGVSDAANGDADVILIDRPVATALPAIALAAERMHRASRDASRDPWPAGVRAVVPADLDTETLAAVITVVAAGFALTAPGNGGEAEDAGEEDSEEDSGEDSAGSVEAGRPLSAREREVLALMAGGASNKEIALELGLSVSTAKFHVAAIIGKLGARSRVDAVALAVRAGLVMV